MALLVNILQMLSHQGDGSTGKRCMSYFLDMNTPKVTPKDFFLWAGAMISLYAGVFAFISLIFDYINKAFPKPITDSYYYGDPFYGSISYETATLIVLAPVFMLIMRYIRRGIAADPTRNDIWVRRWALVLTVFAAAATMIIDLIVLLTTFLQGEDMTVGFLLKVLTVLLVAGAGFLHFLADLRGYWTKEPSKAKLINWGVGILVLVTIIAGFFIVGTPQEMRRLKQDNVRVQDLQNVQWQIVNYWQQKEALPTTLEDLRDPISETMIPLDPKTGEPYTYTKTGDKTFTLCAVFEEEGGANTVVARPVSATGTEENWKHGAGEVCFERTIDPERYPPYSKGM